jgi:hypothetical protein
MLMSKVHQKHLEMIMRMAVVVVVVMMMMMRLDSYCLH